MYILNASLIMTHDNCCNKAKGFAGKGIKSFPYNLARPGNFTDLNFKTGYFYVLKPLLSTGAPQHYSHLGRSLNVIPYMPKELNTSHTNRPSAIYPFLCMFRAFHGYFVNKRSRINVIHLTYI